MSKNFIISGLFDNLDFQPTESQEGLIDDLAGFIGSGNSREIFLIKGYAGTGKTTIVNSLVKTLKETGSKAVLLAPTLL